MARQEDDAVADAHVHGVPPGLPGLHAFPAVLDGPAWRPIRAANTRALFRLRA